MGFGRTDAGSRDKDNPNRLHIKLSKDNVTSTYARRRVTNNNIRNYRGKPRSGDILMQGFNRSTPKYPSR